MEIQAALGSAARMSNGRRTAEVAARGSLLLVGLVGGLGALAGNLLGVSGLQEGRLDLTSHRLKTAISWTETRN